MALRSERKNKILALSMRDFTNKDFVANVLEGDEYDPMLRRRVSLFQTAMQNFAFSVRTALDVMTVQDFIERFEGKNARRELRRVRAFGEGSIALLDSLFKAFKIPFDLEGGVHAPPLAEESEFKDLRVTDPDEVSLLEDFRVVVLHYPDIAHGVQATLRELASKIKK